MSAAQDSEFVIPPGTVVLDKYRVDAMLGVGGMGMVVKAIHTTLGTPVAIKFLLPQYTASTEAGRRFIREAQAASKISSEHIVRVFDTGSSHPYGPYIVMEFLHGHDLAKHLRQSGVFSVDDAVDFAVQACLALAEAHAQGVVHRDIKPANLFLIEQPGGVPLIKVLDFGISKVIEQTSLEVTKTTAILGSGLYMSPEQMKSSKTVDHRTDVYALGVSLFELLTRTQPFTADSFAELAIKVNMEDAVELRKFRPDVPADLAEVIGRAYAKKADDRYQTVGEFAVALLAWATPRTRMNIETLARREMRRSVGSLPRSRGGSVRPPTASSASLVSEGGPVSSRPKSGPSYPPPFDPSLKIPLPPSLPTPSSMGMDTFGLSKPRSTQLADSMLQTSSDQGIQTERKRKPGAGILGLALVACVLLAAGSIAFIYLRLPTTSIDAGTAPSEARKRASAAAQGSTDPVKVDVEASGSPGQTSTSPTPSASPSPGSTGATQRPTNATTAKTTAQPTASAAATAPSATVAAPPPTVEPTAPATAPCKIRDLDGNLIDCPK